MRKLLTLTTVCSAMLLTGCVDHYYSSPGHLYPEGGDAYHSSMYNGYNRDYQHAPQGPQGQAYYSSHKEVVQGGRMPHQGAVYTEQQVRAQGGYHTTHHVAATSKKPGYSSSQTASNTTTHVVKKKKITTTNPTPAGNAQPNATTAPQNSQGNSGYSSSGG